MQCPQCGQVPAFKEHEIQLEGGDADTDTIEDQSTVDPWKGTQEEPLRSFRGEM